MLSQNYRMIIKWEIHYFVIFRIMKLKLEKLLVDTSRALADIAISEVERNPKLFEEAWELTVKDKYPISMRAARVLDECAEKNPVLMEPFLDEIIERLPEFTIDGVKRGFLRFFLRSKVKLTPNQRGHLVEVCFDFMSAADSSTAIRYYSLGILYKISKKEKSLKPELLDAIEDGILHSRFSHTSIYNFRNKLYKEILYGY